MPGRLWPSLYLFPLPVFEDGVEIFLCPPDKRCEVGHERLAAGRERIFHAGRHLGVDLARQQPVLFQLAECRCEHLLRDVGRPAVDFRKTQAPARMEVVEYQQRPLVPEAVDDMADRAVGVGRGCGFFHVRSAVLNPLKVVITNYPEGESELIEIENNAKNEEMGKRLVSFSRELYVERDDFMEVPVKKYFRLFPGNEVRLKGGYFIKCNDVIKDADGNVTEIHCTYDPDTKSGSGFVGRKVKATIHWVDANNSYPAEFRLFEPLILDDDPANEGKHFLDQINPSSLKIKQGFVEKTAVEGAQKNDKFQFIRNGFYCVDSKYSSDDKLVFNRIVPLKSSFKL